MKVFLNRFGFWIVMVVCVMIYLTLAYKNPFKDNNLISNLEPYPDTILYSFPAWNWVRGHGWNLGINEKIVNISVPNTYGFLLVPLMWILGDIRSFYFTNLIFGIGTLVFFMLGLKNILGKEKWYLIGFFGFLLATNFYFFNQPQLVMAENINYFLISVFLYLMSLKFKWIHLISMIVLVTVTFFLKTSNLVLGGSMVMSFFIKIFWEKIRFGNKKKVLILGGILGLAMLVFYLPKILSLSSNAFNLRYFLTNFKFYSACLSGGVCRNLWYGQKMVSWDIVVMFLVGIGLIFFDKKRRWFLIEISLPLILMVIAMSLFSDTEGRHVEVLLPIMLMVGIVGIDKLFSKIKKPLVFIGIFFLFNIFLTSYQPNNWEMKIISIKKQVGLNFRHREDPWNYLCLRMVDDFMKDKNQAYFGSFLPMYFFDAYNVKLNFLPLATNQDFMLSGRGLQKYFPLPLKNIYDEKLKAGKEIYITDYYASNGREQWRQQWEEIVKGKKIEKVFQSPMDNCNIYKIVESYKVI